MMKKAIVLVSSLALLLIFYAEGSSADGPDGVEVFNRMHCGSCHKAEGKSVGPSLKEMAGLYGEDAEKLILFFKGESESIKTGATTAMMKVQVKKTKALEEADRTALAQYILGFK